MNTIGVTNRKLCNDFYKRIDEISQSSLKYLILREKDLNTEELLEMALRVRDILSKGSIKLIINSNIDVAEKINAYGVQLSFRDFASGLAENYSNIKGISIHNINEAVEAEKLGADYLLYGHVFETDCKKGVPPRGLYELGEICKVVNIPVYAIGGINSENANRVIEAGASGVAVMSSLMKG